MNEIVYDLTLTSSVQSSACDRCRQQKLKCNRLLPCSSCRRKHAECLYTTASSSRKRRRRSVSIADHQQVHGHQVGLNDQDANPISGPEALSSQTGAQKRLEALELPNEEVLPELYTWEGNQMIDFFDYSDFWQSCLGQDSFDYNFEITQSPGVLWRSSINVHLVKRLIDLYITHLVPSMPICLPKPLIEGIESQRYNHDRAFAAYLLALCAFMSLQAPPPSRSVDLGKQFLTEAIRLYNDEHLGENPTIETVFACFHIFGSLWTLGLENAAWLKLQETINLTKLLDIREASLLVTELENWENKIHLYLGLVVVERAFAAGREHSLALPMPSTELLEKFREHARKLGGRDARNAGAMCLLVESFGQLDDGIMTCWRNKCERSQNGFCTKLSRQKMDEILGSFPTRQTTDWQELLKPNEEQNSNDAGDVLLTCLWLQNRLWHLALTHGLLADRDSSEYLQLDFAVHLAKETLRTCKAFRVSSFEGHGQGLAEKIYNIACDFLDVAQWLQHPILSQEEPSPQTVPPGPPVLRGSVSGSTPAPILSGNEEYELPTPTGQLSHIELATGLLGFLAVLDSGQNVNFTRYLHKYQKYMLSHVSP